jgi:hypothetical protein
MCFPSLITSSSSETFSSFFRLLLTNVSGFALTHIVKLPFKALTTNFLYHNLLVFFVVVSIILVKLLIDLFGKATNDEIINGKNSIPNFLFLKFFSFNCFIMLLTNGEYLFVLNSKMFFRELIC